MQALRLHGACVRRNTFIDGHAAGLILAGIFAVAVIGKNSA
jgi:hypothetical protein